jgi:hypothetical protein
MACVAIRKLAIAGLAAGATDAVVVVELDDRSSAAMDAVPGGRFGSGGSALSGKDRSSFGASGDSLGQSAV